MGSLINVRWHWCQSTGDETDHDHLEFPTVRHHVQTETITGCFTDVCVDYFPSCKLDILNTNEQKIILAT